MNERKSLNTLFPRIIRSCAVLQLFLAMVVLWPTTLAADTITVSAIGHQSAQPDMVTVRLGVTRNARTAADALEEVSAAARVLLGQVDAAGIAPADVQTTGFSIHPVWDQRNAQPREIRSYNGTTTLNIHLRQLNGLGALLDELVDGGANMLQGLTFGLSNYNELENAARRDAVLRAREKATVLAEAAGVQLGPVQVIDETNGTAAPGLSRQMLAAESAAIAPGALDVTVSVTVVFGILP